MYKIECEYCEVDRLVPPLERELDVEVMTGELQRTLALADSGELRKIPVYQTMPSELLNLRHVALSGDGEPTLCPNFFEAVRAVIHVRARRRFPFFKMVLF